MRRQHGLTESKNVRRINVQNLRCKSPQCHATCGCTLGTARQARLHGCRPCTWDKKYVQHNSANKKRNNWSVIIRLAGLVSLVCTVGLQDIPKIWGFHRFPRWDPTYPILSTNSGFAFPTSHQSLFHLIISYIYIYIYAYIYIYVIISASRAMMRCAHVHFRQRIVTSWLRVSCGLGCCSLSLKLHMPKLDMHEGPWQKHWALSLHQWCSTSL